MRIVGLTNEAYAQFEICAKALGLTTRELGRGLIENYLKTVQPVKK
jgi:hypothetical protein